MELMRATIILAITVLILSSCCPACYSIKKICTYHKELHEGYNVNFEALDMRPLISKDE